MSTDRQRGTLRVFLGAAPGVGKTYAMLEAARLKQRAGADVVIGWVETHGRAETASLAEGIEQSHATGLSAVAGGISEALVTTAFGLFVAVPAVWAYNWFTNKVEAFGIEMTNSSSELIDYFVNQQRARK